MRPTLFTLPLLALAALGAACGRTLVFLPGDAGLTPDAGPFDAGLPPCDLTVTPTAVDFGQVALGSTVSAQVTLSNDSQAACQVSALSFAQGSDPEFTLAAGQPTHFVLPAGASAALTVDFDAQSPGVPRRRAATLTVTAPVVNDAGASGAVALQATVLVGCQLQTSPSTVDFGAVPLNTQVTEVATLTNAGDTTCDVSQIALDPTGSQLFSLPATQVQSFQLAAGATATIAVAFAADDSTAPHQRQGTLDFTVSQPTGKVPLAPTPMTVPLTAFISTVCVGGSQWIYTVDQSNRLSIFDPQTLQFTDIGVLNCPAAASATPFSMAVDQSAVAWIEFTDGHIYRVDTTSAACTATSFVPNAQVSSFGMGFVFDPSTGVDTLYVAGIPQGASIGTYMPSTLATISFPSLTLTPGATVTFGDPELTGTGDGQLWGFAPPSESQTGIMTLAQIDPATGTTTTVYTYPGVGQSNQNWALKFWGGSFWMFLGQSVYQVDRATGSLSTVLENDGYPVVGAGVSTCAPIQ